MGRKTGEGTMNPVPKIMKLMKSFKTDAEGVRWKVMQSVLSAETTNC